MLRKENDRGAVGKVTELTVANMQTQDVVQAISRIHHEGYDCVELSIGFNNLVNKDTGIGGDVSDPVCVAYIQNKAKVWTEAGRTEIIANRLNGEFVTKIYIKYKFEEDCYVKFVLYDCDTSFKTNDSTGLDLTKQDFLGEAECSLSHIVGMRKHIMKLQKVASGEITVSLMPRPKSNDILHLNLGFSGVRICSFSMFGCCTGSALVYFVISIQHEGRYIPVYKSDYVMTTGTSHFGNLSIQMHKLGNPKVPIRFELFRYENPGSVLLGNADLTIEQLRGLDRVQLQNQELARRGYKNIGELIFMDKAITSRPCFLDYINSGLKIGCQIVVDFTGSNGDPREVGTLHHMHPVSVGTGLQIMTSEYLDAIRCLYGLVSGYDTDGLIPFWGYGAQIPLANGQRAVSWDFAINGNDSNPEVLGMDGVIEAYTRAIGNITLSGPTNFAPIIRKLVSRKTAELASGIIQFDIIIILTDGEISDMQDTIDAIVDASGLPLGFLIIGIGSGRFTNMHVLDADGTRLRASNGRLAVRDNVQFVNFNEHRNDLFKFTEESLAEIPAQLVDSMLAMTPKPLMPSDFGLNHVVHTHNISLSLPPSYRESCANFNA